VNSNVSPDRSERRGLFGNALEEKGGENVTFMTLSALLYFLPTIIARHKSDLMGVFIVNLLFGWTVIGWFVALIWACAAETYVPVRYVPVSSGRFCCQCGSLAPVGAHYCVACGRTV